MYAGRCGDRVRRVGPSVVDTLEPRALLSAVLLNSVPEYDWYYGCSPTAIGMVLGYWDGHGYPNIFPGNASTLTQEVRDLIAGADHALAGQENRPTFLDRRYDGWGDWHNSASLPDHESNPTSLADYIKTVDGTSFAAEFPEGVSRFLQSRGYSGWFMGRRNWGEFGWKDLTASIDAGRPLVGGVDSSGDGVVDHTVTIIGYDAATHQYAAYNTFETTPQWYDFGPPTTDKTYGLGSIWRIQPGSVPAGQSPANGYVPTLPGKIENEYFDNGGEGVAWHDLDSENRGGVYRFASVDVHYTSNTGNDYGVGWVRPGEWLEYTVNVAQAGPYTAEFCVASGVAGGKFHVECDGVNVSGSLSVPMTGGWSKWQTISAPMRLPGGRHVLRLAFDSAGQGGFVGDLDWMRFEAGDVPQLPRKGTPFAVGQTIQAEDFDNGGEGVAYHDTQATNLGGKYRQSWVDIGTTTDTGGGCDVGWTRPGEWLEYTVNVASAGIYDVALRVAAPSAGSGMHLEFDRVVKSASVSVASTGGPQAWRTVTIPGMALSAGTHVLRISFDKAAANGYCASVNWAKIVAGKIATAPTSGTTATPRLSMPGGHSNSWLASEFAAL